MKFYDAVTSGIAHLQQNRLRSGLSILGILIGVASVLCMIAIGDGTQKIIADDIEKLGGPNQVQFWIRPYTYPWGKPKKRTTERYALADVHAIEAECPDVLYVLPQNRKYPRWVTSDQGVQIRSTIEGVTVQQTTPILWDGKCNTGAFFLKTMLTTQSRFMSLVSTPLQSYSEIPCHLDKR